MCFTVYYHPNFLGRDSVTRAAFTGKLLQQLQREFGKQVLERAWGELQLQHLSLESCSHHSTQDWLCPPGHADTVLPGKLLRSGYPAYPLSLSLDFLPAESDPAKPLPSALPPAPGRHPHTPW